MNTCSSSKIKLTTAISISIRVYFIREQNLFWNYFSRLENRVKNKNKVYISSPIVHSKYRSASQQAIISAAMSAPQASLTQLNNQQVPSSNETSGSANSIQSRRQLQHVSTKADRKRVIKWMIAEVERSGTDNRIASKAVLAHPTVFRASRRANREKARHWWKTRDFFLAQLKTAKNKQITVSARAGMELGTRRIAVKAFTGRGRKRAPWVEYLHTLLMIDFERFQELSIKMTPKILQLHALHILSDTTAPFHGEQENVSGKKLKHLVTASWTYAFMRRFNIVIRKQSGALARSESHKFHTDQMIAYHLGQLERDFHDGNLVEDMVENMDETHFVFNMDDHTTLGFIGQAKVNYADVVSGGEGMTMVLRISGGVNSKIEAPFIIFTNKKRSYPIQGIPDDVEGVSYRTGPKGWMDQKLFVDWLSEPRAIDKDPAGRTRVIFMDNCSAHNETPEQLEALEKINAKIRKLPANSTHLCQPLDSFVIQKVKEVWRKEWEAEKLKFIENGDWSSGRNGSGKLNNPGKHFFLQLASKAVQKVNSMSDNNGVSYARKAMIRCGLAPDTDGTWKVSQLFKPLQEIIARHHINFCGVPPDNFSPWESSDYDSGTEYDE